jgi:hypothetical protein
MHVVRFAAAFETMYQDCGRSRFAIPLPVAATQQLRAWLDGEQSIFLRNIHQL